MQIADTNWGQKDEFYAYLSWSALKLYPWFSPSLSYNQHAKMLCLQAFYMMLNDITEGLINCEHLCNEANGLNRGLISILAKNQLIFPLIKVLEK